MMLPTHLRHSFETAFCDFCGTTLSAAEADALGTQLLDTLGLMLRTRARAIHRSSRAHPIDTQENKRDTAV
jgi:hypothetical protein